MKKKFLRTFLVSFLAFVLIYSGAIYYWINFKKDGNDEKGGNFLTRLADDQDELTFLLLGIDSKDITKRDKERSDTMMLCKVDKSSGQVSILSIPRDSRVVIRGRKNEEKINHAHAYGGPELSVKTVRDLLGIDLDYYVRVDYKLVKDVVELIGGVEMNVPINMNYDDPTADPPLHIHLKKGNQVLDGDKAMEFLRFRKGYKDQDLGRIKAQQEFVKAAISQALKPSNITKVPGMIKSYYSNVDTNIPFDLLTKFALKFNKIDVDNIQTATLQGEPKTIDGVSYYVLYKEENEDIVNNMFLEHKTVENQSEDLTEPN